MRTGEREQTRGAEGLLPRENVKFKSSEMAINASKTANSNINLQLLHRLKTTSYNLAPTLDQNLNE